MAVLVRVTSVRLLAYGSSAGQSSTADLRVWPTFVIKVVRCATRNFADGNSL